MRILFASPGYKPAYRIGGLPASVTALAEALARRGHAITVFTTNANLDEDLDVPVDQPLDIDGVRVWYFRRTEFLRRWVPFVPYLSQSSGYLYAPRMAAELRTVVPTVDVVHTQMPFVYPTYAAAKAAAEFGKPLFYSQRGVLNPVHMEFRSLKKRVYMSLIERPILRQAAAVIALTPEEADQYRAQGTESPCRVIPNGIDLWRFRTEPVGGALEGWGIPQNRPVVLFLGRLHP